LQLARSAFVLEGRSPASSGLYRQRAGKAVAIWRDFRNLCLSTGKPMMGDVNDPMQTTIGYTLCDAARHVHLMDER
jgi:hypothetical protein